MGQKVYAKNIIRAFRDRTGDKSMRLNDVHRLMARYGMSPIGRSERGPMYDWDDVDYVLNAIYWDKRNNKFQLNYPKQQKEEWPEEDYSAPEEHMEYFMNKEVCENIEENKVIKNDEGNIVPDKCPKCGSEIKLYIKGEPVYLCSNKDCNEYFGTAPCNLHENLELELANERKNINTNPTEAQKKAGNYKMGHITINGYDITIENPKGSYRSGTDDKGKKWRVLMKNDYGYFTKTKGYDGDAIDVFIGNKLNSDKIFVVDQYNGNKFDESKVMLGFNSAEEAKKAYNSNHEKGWDGCKKVTGVSDSVFKKWLYDNKKQRKPFYQYVEIENKKINESKNKKKIFLTEKQLGDIKQTLNEITSIDKYNKERNRTKWNQRDFIRICQSDPTYNREKDIVGKYTNWLLNKLQSIEQLEQIRVPLEWYADGAKKGILIRQGINNDINTYKTIDEFIGTMNNVMNSNDSNMPQNEYNNRLKLKDQFIVLGSSQLSEIENKLNEGKYPIHTDKVKVVKKYLDDNFIKGSIANIGEDGYPTSIKIVALKGSDGSAMKNMTDIQLFDMLQDKFFKLYADRDNRDRLLKQIIKDWYKGKITNDGMLTVNFV